MAQIEQMTAEQLQMACEAVEVGTFAYNIDTDETVWNSVFRHFVGYVDDEVITLEEFLTHVNPEDVPGIKKRLELIITGEITEYYAEYRVMPIGKTEEIWLGFTGKIRPGTHVMYGIVMDITDRKKRDEFLIELLKKKQTSKKQIKQFVELLRSV